MRNALPLLWMLVALANGGCVLFARAEEIDLGAAGEIVVPSVRNRAYFLEGSADGQTWQDVAGPWFGNGGELRALYSKRGFPAALTQFRIHDVRAATVGPAPTSPIGMTLSLQESKVQSRNCIFLTNTTGVIKTANASARSFQYTWTKMAGDEIRLELTQRNGATDALDLHFRGPSVGLSKRLSVDSTGQKWDPEGGPFALIASIEWDVGGPGTGSTCLPHDPAGETWAVSDGDTVYQLRFTPTGGTRIESTGQESSFSYIYELLENAQASLTLTSSIWSHNLALSSSNPSGGSYVKTAAATTAEKGTFARNPKPLPPGGLDPCDAPNTLSGRTFAFANPAPGAQQKQLTFDDDSAGTVMTQEGGAIEFTPFSYTYKRKGETEGKTVLSFPGVWGDQLEELELTFNEDCSGSYVRRTFVNGQLASTQTGSFGPGVPLAGLVQFLGLGQSFGLGD